MKGGGGGGILSPLLHQNQYGFTLAGYRNGKSATNPALNSRIVKGGSSLTKYTVINVTLSPVSVFVKIHVLLCCVFSIG